MEPFIAEWRNDPVINRFWISLHRDFPLADDRTLLVKRLFLCPRLRYASQAPCKKSNATDKDKCPSS